MRGRAAGVLVPGLVVLALVAVVAIAATGTTPTGTNDARPPSSTLLDTLLSLGLVAVLLGGVLFVYGLTQRKAIAREVASGRYRRVGLIYVLVMLAFLVVTYFRLRDWQRPPPEEVEDPVLAGGRPTPVDAPPGAGPDSAYEPRFAWIPVLLVLGLAVAGAAAYALAMRRRARAADEDQDLAETLADVLDDTLDDLRAERDPRRAVIAAYARMEGILAAYGVSRRPAETSGEYLSRVLRSLDVDAQAVARLTELFSMAKFSQHEVDLAMKEAAIDALEHVRDELRAARAAQPEPPAAGLEVEQPA